MTNDIKWENQHCGVHQANYGDLLEYMPDLKELIYTFPENPNDFIWDVKVHMLMPSQFPCIPNWHYDNVPTCNEKQHKVLWRCSGDVIKPEVPMYLWISGAPLTEFRKGDKTWFIKPKTWTKISQTDEHRGTASEDYQWRGFIRATHKDIAPPNKKGKSCLRRHSQVYLDATNFKW
jgi:hypothetical protein